MIQRIDTFIGPLAKGNQHYLVAANTVDNYEARRLSFEIPHSIVIRFPREEWLNAGNLDSLPPPVFWQAGTPVRRCGSGTIALAYWIRKYVKNTPNAFSFFWCNSSGRTTGGFSERSERFYYSAQPLPYRLCQVTSTLRNSVNILPYQLYEVGGPDDYLLAVFKTLSELKGLHVFSRNFSFLSRRALIATAPAQGKYDYGLRYFAPQYGQLEDPATGSAHCMAAGYWQRRLRKREVRGRQYSSKGGCFWVRSEQNEQRVTGLAKSVGQVDTWAFLRRMSCHLP